MVGWVQSGDREKCAPEQLIVQLHSQDRAFVVVSDNGVVALTANFEAAVLQTKRAAFVNDLLDVAVADRKMY